MDGDDFDPNEEPLWATELACRVLGILDRVAELGASRPADNFCGIQERFDFADDDDERGLGFMVLGGREDLTLCELVARRTGCGFRWRIEVGLGRRGDPEPSWIWHLADDDDRILGEAVVATVDRLCRYDPGAGDPTRRWRSRGRRQPRDRPGPSIRETLAACPIMERAISVPRGFPRRRSSLWMLESYLDCNGADRLTAEEVARFDDYLRVGAPGKRSFCRFFGPERVVPALEDFLGMHLLRVRMERARRLARACDFSGALAEWLGSLGFADGVQVRRARDYTDWARKHLPRAQRLSNLLCCPKGSNPPRRGWEAQQKGEYVIERIEPGSLWLREPDGPVRGPFLVPRRATALLRRGWSVHGILGKREGTWLLKEAWLVVPTRP